MEEGFPCIFEEGFKLLSVNDETDIRRMVQDLEALHLDPISSLPLRTFPIAWEKDPPGNPRRMEEASSRPLLFHLLKKPFFWNEDPFVLPLGHLLHLVIGIDHEEEAILIDFLEEGVSGHLHAERGG